jgi:hypothetical protein
LLTDAEKSVPPTLRMLFLVPMIVAMVVIPHVS